MVRAARLQVLGVVPAAGDGLAEVGVVIDRDRLPDRRQLVLGRDRADPDLPRKPDLHGHRQHTSAGDGAGARSHLSARLLGLGRREHLAPGLPPSRRHVRAVVDVQAGCDLVRTMDMHGSR